MLKFIQQVDNMLIITRISLSQLAQDFDFVHGSFSVVASTLLNLEGNIAGLNVIEWEPNSGEMAPAELTNNVVSSLVDFSNIDRMVTTCDE